MRNQIAPARDAQARCDQIQAEFRSHPERKSIRRDPQPLAAALVPTDDELKVRLAEELDYARRMLDSMGDQLSADMGVLMRHGTALQSIDIVGQILGHIANVTRSSDPAGAVERIGMCELKARLKRSKID
ncbi:MAG: hypothetical protein V4502_12985 [Pseudomonadota bacterium]